jgi:hypothetical protein
MMVAVIEQIVTIARRRPGGMLVGVAPGPVMAA